MDAERGRVSALRGSALRVRALRRAGGAGGSRLLQFAAFALVLASVPAVFTRVGFYTMANAVIMAIMALAAVGLVLVMGYAGQVSLGQAAFYGIGAYSSALLTTEAGLHPVVATVAGMVVAGALAALVGRSIFRARGHYLAMATLAFGLVVFYLAKELPFTGGPSGLPDVPKLALGGLVLDSDLRFWWLVAGALFVAVLLARNLVDSRVGRALRAVGDSEAAAATSAIDVRRHKVIVFTVGAVLAAAAGSLYAHWTTFVDPTSTLDLLLSVQLLIMATVGGLRSVWGAPVGAFVVVSLSQGARELLPRIAPRIGGEFEIIVYGLALILVLLFVPDGIAGGTRRLADRAGTLARARRRAAAPARTGRAAAATSAPRPAPADPPPGVPVLAVNGLRRSFGGVLAIDGVDLVLPALVPAPVPASVGAGGGAPAAPITGLIGPNGAGKTTLFNLLSGLAAPEAGRVELLGEDVTGRRPDQVARLGLARTFQNLELFGSLTVLENVQVARHGHTRAGALTALARLPRGGREERGSRDAALAVLDRVGIAHLAGRPAAGLPLGDQRRVEVARALAGEPRLLLLDEPLAGLTAADADALVALIRDVAADGVTVLVVEHDMRAVMGLCDRVVVLNQGRVIADAAPAAVQDDPAVLAAYLGAGLGDLPDPVAAGVDA